MSSHAVCDLLHRCARDRESAEWEELVARYGPRLAAGVRRALRRAGLTADREQVEELLQEVYCRLLEHGGRRLLSCRGRSEGEVGAYLCRLAANLTVDHQRAAAAAKRGGGRPIEAPRNGRDELADRLPDPAASPEERALTRERYRLLLARCRDLAGGRKGQRNLRIFRLAVVEGWSSREIAEALPHGLAPSSVDSLVSRLRRRLRDGLRPCRA